MRISESCARCLYERQKNKTEDAAYLDKVRSLLDHRRKEDCSPYMVYLFQKAYEERFGKRADYRGIKKKFNDLVLGMEDQLQGHIAAAADPLAMAMALSRAGNYIDYGAMDQVEPEMFLGLLKKASMRDADWEVYEAFVKKMASAKKMLLITDNCGEIVLDKLLIGQLKKEFPDVQFTVMVRGKEVLNDATKEDALYVGMDKAAKVVDNGEAVAGTIYGMLSEDGRRALEEADVILAKGQGNYESLSGTGYHVFYAFLCKCELFEKRFQVPKLTGMFVEEK